MPSERLRIHHQLRTLYGAGFTFLVGMGIRHFQTIGIPVAMSALVFLVGLALVPFGEETKGKYLPS